MMGNWNALVMLSKVDNHQTFYHTARTNVNNPLESSLN
jgi:hypothetical protein